MLSLVLVVPVLLGVLLSLGLGVGVVGLGGLAVMRNLIEYRTQHATGTTMLLPHRLSTIILPTRSSLHVLLLSLSVRLVVSSSE